MYYLILFNILITPILFIGVRLDTEADRQQAYFST